MIKETEFISNISSDYIKMLFIFNRGVNIINDIKKQMESLK